MWQMLCGMNPLNIPGSCEDIIVINTIGKNILGVGGILDICRYKVLLLFDLYSVFMMKGKFRFEIRILFHIKILQHVDEYIHLGIFWDEHFIYRVSHLKASTH